MARYRTIAGIEHVVYNSIEEFKASNPDGLVALDWRKGREGDWVLADDGAVMQILKFGKIFSRRPREYIRTAPGTFVILPNTYLDSRFRENPYSFGGSWPAYTKPSTRDRAFGAYIILGCDPLKAYMEIFRSKNEAYAKEKAYSLLARGNIMSAIRDSIERAGGKTGATLEWAMASIKETVDDSENESIKLKGADMIAEYHGAKSKENVSPMEPAGGFKGFGVSELPEGEKRQLPENASTPLLSEADFVEGAPEEMVGAKRDEPV